MRTRFGLLRRKRGCAATRLFHSLFATLFLPITASAEDQASLTGKSLDGDGGASVVSPMAVNRPERNPRWTISAEAIALARTGGVNRTLVERVAGVVPFLATSTASGAEVFNSNQFRQGFSAGPKVALTYHDPSGYGAELSFFNIFDQSATGSIGPDSPPAWLVMKAPGIFWQTQDFPYQAMVWNSTTSLYGAEASGRFTLSSRVTVLAGFRWLQLNDSLQGALTPADLTAPTWKSTCPGCNLFQVTPGGTVAGNYPPFWNTSTTNNLYGVQVGLAGKILELGRFSLDGLIKIGIFENNAEQSTGVSLQKVVYSSSATANHAAFVGEANLQVKYRVIDGLALKAGYAALWLDGVALAPGQIQETLTTASGVRALGVNCGAAILFQGATVGVEYSF